MFKRAISLLVGVLLLSSCLQAGTVLDKTLDDARGGDAEAQYHLGFLYDNGREFSKALEWYTQAAQQGHAIAQFRLGRLYIMGEAVARDYAQAYVWLKLAEEQGYAQAAELSGNMKSALSSDQLIWAEKEAAKVRKLYAP